MAAGVFMAASLARLQRPGWRAGHRRLLLRLKRIKLTLGLVTAAVLGFATAITMLGPLLVDVSRELGVPLGQAGTVGRGHVVALGAWARRSPGCFRIDSGAGH